MIAALRHQLTRLRFTNPCPLNALASLHASASAEAQPEIGATLYESLVHKHSFPPKSASRIATAAANTLANYPAKSDSVISFLQEIGFSHSQLEKMLKSMPRLLLVGDVERTMRPKIDILLEFGISPGDAAEIISNDPWIMRRSLDRTFIPSLTVLKELLGSNELAKFLKASGWFLKTNLAKNLIPNVEFLRECGVAMDQINWMVYHFPRLMLRRPEGVRSLVERVEGMGVERSSRMFIHAVRVLSSMSNETWEIKIRAFRAIGFSEDEVAAAFRNIPVVFALSEKKVNEAKEVIISSGKYDLPCIVKYPGSLMYSTERRYKPRIKVLKALEREGLLRSWPAYSSFHRWSDKLFCDKYVVPYLDTLGDVCVPESAANGRLVVK